MHRKPNSNLRTKASSSIAKAHNKRAKPFLRWAGGKARFANDIVAQLPPLGLNATYYEPFLGAGSVFLAYQPQRAVLSDLNRQLVEAFGAIKRDYREVHKRLQIIVHQDSEDYYYRVRNQYNMGGVKYTQAARFIYLNQACFNGIFRVNKRGEFNVPYGNKARIAVPTLEQLDHVAKLLRRAQIKACSFKKAIENASRGDIIYLDPPYPPLNGTSYFTHYTKDRFPDRKQREVAEVANKLSKRGCYVCITNADTQKIRSLYRGWRKIAIERPRWITSSNRKQKVGELIIANYDL